jgi:copper chaperone NosL
MANSFLLKAAVASIVFLLFGCSKNEPVPIHYGQDQCDYCRMNIVDNAFGSELVTGKGKVFKFDSIECLAAYSKTSTEDHDQTSSLWITDYLNPETFLNVKNAIIVLNEQHNSPMGVGLVGFSSVSQASEFVEATGGRIVSWPETCDIVTLKWKL